jgi:hypothetical protein
VVAVGEAGDVADVGQDADGSGRTDAAEAIRCEPVATTCAFNLARIHRRSGCSIDDLHFGGRSGVVVGWGVRELPVCRLLRGPWLSALVGDVQ